MNALVRLAIRSIVVTGAFGSTACGVTYLEHDAPGIADIRTPPPPSAPRRVEVPEDPGGHLVIVSYGLFAGIGGEGGTAFDSRFAYGVGPELSIAKGVTRYAHPDGFPYPIMQWGYGVNLGWTALRRAGDHIGPMYAEAELRVAELAIAAGWVWAPVDKTHGPQATISFGPFFLRGTHELDFGTQVNAGILFKGYSAWSWSR